jgi:hypothetical protein
MRIFISHGSRDREPAALIVDLGQAKRDRV